jgi:hypothetical protein
MAGKNGLTIISQHVDLFAALRQSLLKTMNKISENVGAFKKMKTITKYSLVYAGAFRFGNKRHCGIPVKKRIWSVSRPKQVQTITNKANNEL